MASWLAGMAAFLLAASPGATVGDLAWLAGDWVREADGRWTEESWMPPRGGVMLGISRSGRGDMLREYEFLQLRADADGVPAYVAQPQGGAPVAFRLVQRDATSARFENAAHDYPQRIDYVRTGDTLTATISRIDGSKSQSWAYRRR